MEGTGQAGLSVVFQRDGHLALIKTEEQIVKLLLEDEVGVDRNDVALSRITQENTEGMSVFNFGEEDMVLTRRDKGRASVSLTMLSEVNQSNFSGTTFEMNENVVIVEIIENADASMEFPLLRLIGIRGCEEVLCWEAR